MPVVEKRARTRVPTGLGLFFSAPLRFVEAWHGAIRKHAATPYGTCSTCGQSCDSQSKICKECDAW